MNNSAINVYFSKLESCGISSEVCEKIKEKLGDDLYNASYGMKSNDGTAYEGSVIDISLTKLALFAVKLNELYPEDIRVDVKSLVKICLLQHISKSVRYIKSTDTWRINNLGELYKYNQEVPAIGIGLHSMMLAINCGVEFTTEESEAMTVIDRSEDDNQMKYYSSLLTSIVRQANEMVYCYYRAKNTQKLAKNQ
jgi:hypothetical protein